MTDDPPIHFFLSFFFTGLCKCNLPDVVHSHLSQSHLHSHAHLISLSHCNAHSHFSANPHLNTHSHGITPSHFNCHPHFSTQSHFNYRALHLASSPLYLTSHLHCPHLASHPPLTSPPPTTSTPLIPHVTSTTTPHQHTTPLHTCFVSSLVVTEGWQGFEGEREEWRADGGGGGGGGVLEQGDTWKRTGRELRTMADSLDRRCSKVIKCVYT